MLLSRLPFLPQARPLLEQLAERSGLDTMTLIDGDGTNEMGIRSRQRGMQRLLEAVLRVEAAVLPVRSLVDMRFTIVLVTVMMQQGFSVSLLRRNDIASF